MPALTPVTTSDVPERKIWVFILHTVGAGSISKRKEGSGARYINFTTLKLKFRPAGHIEMLENDSLASVPCGNLAQFPLHLKQPLVNFFFRTKWKQGM